MKGSKLLKNEYVFSILSRFASVALSLLQSVLVARYLGKALQGVSAYITSITNVGAIVITFGMHQAYPYFRKKLGRDAIFHDYMSLIVGLYALFLALGCALAMAAAGTVAELISPGEWDTVTVPVTILILALVLL